MFELLKKINENEFCLLILFFDELIVDVLLDYFLVSFLLNDFVIFVIFIVKFVLD